MKPNTNNIVFWTILATELQPKYATFAAEKAKGYPCSLYRDNINSHT